MGNVLVHTRVFCLAFAIGAAAAPAAATPAGDRFLEGVATAVLELEFGLTGLDLRVEDGRLLLDSAELAGHTPEAVRARLDGLHGLEVRLETDAPAPTLRMVADTSTLPPPTPAAAAHAAPVTGFLPGSLVFEPPLADPRAPAFAVGYQRHFGDDSFTNVGRADIGGSLPLYGWEMAGGTWQIAAEAGVFSIFDLDRPSMELINADYVASLPLQARYGDLAGRVRVLHQSSHLGDEFLLRTETDRLNLSYEAVDFLLAYDVAEWARVYGGGSHLLRRRPRDLDPLGAQAGLELRGQDPILGDIVYPVAGVDLQSWQETGWDADLSLRGGVELHNGFLSGTRVQLLAEYFNGRSPNGQFYERRVDYAGLGVRVLF